MTVTLFFCARANWRNKQCSPRISRGHLLGYSDQLSVPQRLRFSQLAIIKQREITDLKQKMATSKLQLKMIPAKNVAPPTT